MELQVFTRVARATGKQSNAEGGQAGFGEIDLESMAPEPEQSELPPASESPFEVFSREPGYTPAPAPVKAERDRYAGPRELDIETTAYAPPDTFTPDEADLPVISLEDELPRIDLTQELDLEVDLAGDFEPGGPVPAEPDQAEILPEAPPSIDLAQELRSDALEEESEEFMPEEEPPDAEAGRGVFDTETLASIYSNQGFYGRAAEIYQKLIAQRPDDPSLRNKLEGVLALERGEAGITETVAAAEPTDSEKTISRLQMLLETFKGGRPQ